jgi:hypothetical protein
MTVESEDETKALCTTVLTADAMARDGYYETDGEHRWRSNESIAKRREEHAELHRTAAPKLASHVVALEAENARLTKERDEARRDRNKAETEANLRLIPRDMFPSAATKWDSLTEENARLREVLTTVAAHLRVMTDPKTPQVRERRSDDLSTPEVLRLVEATIALAGPETP